MDHPSVQQANDFRSLIVAMLCADADGDLPGWELLTQNATGDDLWELVGGLSHMCLDLGASAAGSPAAFRALLASWRPGYTLRGEKLDN